jgi:hypothetical protein
MASSIYLPPLVDGCEGAFQYITQDEFRADASVAPWLRVEPRSIFMH